MSVQLLCESELREEGRRGRRERIRNLTHLYDRERSLRMLLPPLCTNGLDPMRSLNPRWHRDDAATTRELCRHIVSSLRYALWFRSRSRTLAIERRIDGLRSALAAEAIRYRQQRDMERSMLIRFTPKGA